MDRREAIEILAQRIKSSDVKSVSRKFDMIADEVRGWNSRIRKELYVEYLESDEWKERRKAVLKRDKNKCRFCGKKATHIHHLTYKNIFQEPLYDLVSLCNGCHQLIHAIEEVSDGWGVPSSICKLKRGEL